MFTEEEQRSFEQYQLSWLQFGEDPDEREWPQIRDDVNQVYAELGLPEPLIVQCTGPLPQCIFPALVHLMLNRGEAHSTHQRFQNTYIESDEVRYGWHNIWKEALSAINWKAVSPEMYGIGENLNVRIERFFRLVMQPRIVAKIDECIGIHRNQTLEYDFENDLLPKLQNMQRATITVGPELENYWDNFCSRLPENLLADLKAMLKIHNHGLPFTKEAPRQDLWMGAWDWWRLAVSGYAVSQFKCDLNSVSFEQLELWIRLANSNLAYLFYENCCFVYRKPRFISFDERGRLHNGERSSAEFIDGTQFFVWHGVEVPDFVILEPRKIKIKTIENEANVEVRRVMIDRYGLEDFIRGSAARKIQQDECGCLYRAEFRDDEPMVIVRVTNSTPEPDGSFKDYFLRVPPSTRTAREGIAWTFELDEDDYSPIVET